jgi:hypothetical protein
MMFLGLGLPSPTQIENGEFSNCPLGLLQSLLGLLHKSYSDHSFPRSFGGPEGFPHPQVWRDCRTVPAPSSKSWNFSPLTEKRNNLQHNKNPARGNTFSIPLSEEYCWSSRRKKPKTTTTQAEGIKILTKNNSRCINLNTE